MAYEICIGRLSGALKCHTPHLDKPYVDGILDTICIREVLRQYIPQHTCVRFMNCSVFSVSIPAATNIYALLIDLNIATSQQRYKRMMVKHKREWMRMLCDALGIISFV